ncbi:MAG TPA: amino acid racemase [Pyrinomonadaceae bacterium]
MKTTLGVVGGLGPLASAEFLNTIYECSLDGVEQESPLVVMSSDPSFPDRTEAFLRGECDELLHRLVRVLRQLNEMGASKTVICCVTIHYLLPLLPPDLRAQVVSLLDVIMDQVAHSRKRHLLICSKGARRLGLFQNHVRWNFVKDRIVLPDDEDQEEIHYEIIYRIKRKPDVRQFIPRLESLLVKYEADAFIAGCTEIHLLAKYFLRSNHSYGCIDPLVVIAQELAAEYASRRPLYPPVANVPGGSIAA